MNRPLVAAILFLAVLFVADLSYGQQPAASPNATSTTSTGDAKKKEAEATTSAPTSEPVVTPEPDFWHQEYMTGDWGGARSRWKEKGIELEFKLTQFFQGVTSGGTRHDSEYNGTFEYALRFDLGKVAGWKFWSSEIKAEARFGGPLLGGTGGLNPVNTAAITPGSDGEVISVTAVNFTRIIPKDLKKGDLFAVSFGRFNLLDLSDEEFFGGAGKERFFNMAQIGPLTVLRQIPLITNGVTFAYVRGGKPFLTLAVLDPNDHSNDPGLDDLFADGVTLSPTIFFHTKHFAKTAKHSFGGAVTTKKYTPFDAIRQIVIPGPAVNPVEPKRGSWSVNYVFRQYLIERGPKDGWGLFSQVAFADKDTSPITRFFDIGLGGNGLIKSRQRDEFGISYAYTDLSSVLKDNLDLLTIGNRSPIAEHQVEMFYNLHLTPWLRLTGDLQIIRPIRQSVDRAIVPGGRLELIF